MLGMRGYREVSGEVTASGVRVTAFVSILPSQATCPQ